MWHVCVCQVWVSAVISSQDSVVRQRTTTSRPCLWSRKSATMWASFLPTAWEKWVLMDVWYLFCRKTFCINILECKPSLEILFFPSNNPRNVLVFEYCCHSQKTHAFHRLQDDIPAEVKQRRLEECISVFREEAARVNAALIGSTQLILVEGVSTAHSIQNSFSASVGFAPPQWFLKQLSVS